MKDLLSTPEGHVFELDLGTVAEEGASTVILTPLAGRPYPSGARFEVPNVVVLAAVRGGAVVYRAAGIGERSRGGGVVLGREEEG